MYKPVKVSHESEAALQVLDDTSHLRTDQAKALDDVEDEIRRPAHDKDHDDDHQHANDALKLFQRLLLNFVACVDGDPGLVAPPGSRLKSEHACLEYVDDTHIRSDYKVHLHTSLSSRTAVVEVTSP